VRGASLSFALSLLLRRDWAVAAVADPTNDESVSIAAGLSSKPKQHERRRSEDGKKQKEEAQKAVDDNGICNAKDNHTKLKRSRLAERRYLLRRTRHVAAAAAAPPVCLFPSFC
jgi:hypothetical protein